MKWLSKLTLHLLAAMFIAVLAVPSHLLAIGPSISAQVYDGQPARLTITSPQDGATVASSPVTVQGEVHNISQIMVYIDDTYSMTYPVDNGATTYSFTASAGAGSHILKLIAINPYNGTTIEQSINFTYTPGAQPSLPAEAVQTATQTAQVTQQYLQGQVDQASASKPAAFLSDVSYEVMSALDIIPVTGSQSLPRMTTRFWSISAGTALIILTQPMVALYHLARYRLLAWNVHALPAIVQHHALFVLRTGGALLLAVGFFI